MGAHTDIRAGGWVARLPAAWRPFVLLARFDRPVGAWLLVLPGFWAIVIGAADARAGGRLLLLFLVGAFVTRAAGCVVNDLWDRELDRRVSRTAGRPLAAGTVSVAGALLFLAVLGGIGLLVLAGLDRAALGWGLLAAVPVTLYPLAKRVTDFPQAVLGLTFSWGALLGSAAATGGVRGWSWALYAAAFAWILGYDTIYAHQDRAEDPAAGIRSTATRFGARTRPFLAGCYAGMLGLLVVAGWAAGLGWAFLAGLSLPAGLLAWQVATLDVHDPARCLRQFGANREVGLAVTLALLLGRL